MPSKTSKLLRGVAGSVAAAVGGGLSGIVCGTAMVNDRASLADAAVFVLGLLVLVGGFALVFPRRPRRILTPNGILNDPACEPPEPVATSGL
jgi:hypothetical protein